MRIAEGDSVVLLKTLVESLVYAGSPVTAFVVFRQTAFLLI